MNFPKYWARGNSGAFRVWRWSSQSMAEAQTLADQAARQFAERFQRGDPLSRRDGYYPDRPFREEILHEFQSPAGEVAAVVTRNSHGCEVLNTARVMFVDIDLPEPKRPGFFQRLFGGAKPAPETPTLAGALARIETWTRGNAQWGWRIYRTRAGLRLLATQSLVEADSPEANAVFQALGADPLYQKLCQSQKCFRARLTPKPWRCGLRSKPPRWPWLEAGSEKLFKSWEAQYRSFSANWATCELLQTIGNPTVHPDVQSTIQVHDLATRAESKLPLA